MEYYDTIYVHYYSQSLCFGDNAEMVGERNLQLLLYPSWFSGQGLDLDLLDTMTAEQQAMVLAQIMFSPEWLEGHPEIMDTVIQLAPSRSASPEIIQQQGLASATWKGSCDRLANVTQPTLVIAGDPDLLAPAANSIMMSQRIPNSWLVIIQGIGHGMMLQVPNEFSAIIQTFLRTAK